MASRAVWSGMLSVGIVHVPVKLYKATDDYETGLKELHSACNLPMSRQHFCFKCNASVPYSDVVKGAKQDDGTFVVLTQSEVDSVKSEKSDVIAVTSFVPLNTIDPLFIEANHYVMPSERGAQEAYALLVQAMHVQQRAAQARFSFYGRERTVTIRAMGSTLVMQSMRDENHVRAALTTPGYVPTVTANPQALKLAEQVIAVYAENAFDPAEYEDEQAKARDALIAARKSGKPLPAAAVSAPPAPTRDLMSALKGMLDAKQPPTRKKMAKVEAVTKRTKRKAS